MTVRVAYLINQYPKVSHTFIRREILSLEKQGVEVQRIALRGWDAQVADPQDVGEQRATQFVLQRGLVGLLVGALSVAIRSPMRFLSALRMATRIGMGRSDRALPYHWVYLAEACVVAKWIQDSKATHLHAHFGTNSAEVAMLVNAVQGTPYSFTVHGPEEFDRPEFIALAEKCRRAAFVVAISSFGRSQIYRWIDHSDWQKVHVVHCGLDALFLDQAQPGLPVPSRLVCVGRLCEQKGQLLLLSAMRALFDRDIRFELVLAGDGELREVIDNLTETLGLRSNVRITGWISSEKVREEILGARALVLPSFAEGLPVVLMEAMALSRPVISTYVAGIPELVEHGKSGWLFPAGDVAQLANAIEECLGSSVDRVESMGAAARERVIARHSIDPQAARLAELMRRPSSLTTVAT